MGLPSSSRSACAAFALAIGFSFPVLVASAQQAPPPPATAEVEPPAPVIKAIAIEDVPQQAEATSAQLESMLANAASAEELEKIESELETLKQEVGSSLESAKNSLTGEPTVRQLQEIERRLLNMVDRLRAPDSELDAAVRELGEALKQLDVTAPTWKATEEAARVAGAAAPTRKRIAAVRREIERVRKELIARRNEILGLRDSLVDPKATVDRSLTRVRGDISSRLEGIFTLDREPLWSSKVRESVAEELQPGWTQPIEARLDEVFQYTLSHPGPIGFQIAMFAVLCLALRRLEARARSQAEENYDLRDAELVFQRPNSMALVIALGLTPQIHASAPYLFPALVMTVVVIPAVLIARKFAPHMMIPLVTGVPVLFLWDRVRILLETLPTIERLALFLELVAALAFVLWLMRPSRFAQVSEDVLRDPYFRIVGVGVRIAVVLMALAIVSEIIGFGIFADLLSRGTLRSAYGAVLFYAVLKVAEGLLAYALVIRPLRLLRIVSRYRWLVRRRLDRTLQVVAALAWVYVVLNVFGADDVFFSGAAKVLDAGVAVGALSVSVADVMIFVFTLWLSFTLARFINFVLEEDVFTRLSLARGVPYAVSSLIRYTFIFLGFLVALAAAGIELSRLTVIVGGLGVGIGFGLQNVVNNFVSGLILLFERPLQVGDTVQIQSQGLWGEITRIGIRASTVKTWDGAEVIVPNGHLVSELVTNWTLSDRRRRVEVNVGVEYGTDAQRVIDLLVEVAKANEQVLDDPAPNAFFMNFGDSALEFRLRGWISDFNVGYMVRSQLSVSVQRALREAGIGVPFPQRDLHLRSVSPGVASELERLGRKPSES